MKTLTQIAIAASIALTALAAPASAGYRHKGHWHGSIHVYGGYNSGVTIKVNKYKAARCHRYVKVHYGHTHKFGHLPHYHVNNCKVKLAN